jgi:hypothetical protein
MLRHASLAPSRPSDDFVIDHMIDWANSRGIKCTDDRDHVGYTNFTFLTWEQFLAWAAELGAAPLKVQAIANAENRTKTS